MALAADIPTAIVATNDGVLTGSSMSDSPTLTFNTGTTMLMLKFVVPPGAVLNGRPNAAYPAKVRLKTKAAVVNGPANIALYPANNVWTGSSGTPKVLTTSAYLIKKMAAPASAGLVEFDVSDYITGPGTFSFVAKLEDCSASASLQVASNDPVNPIGDRPTITVLRPDENSAASFATAQDFYQYLQNYFKVTVPNVLTFGNQAIERYKQFNSTNNGTADVEDIGFFNATKPPYNLGATTDPSENFYALQRCINEARDARVAVYIPAGTYAINQQVQLIQHIMDLYTTVDNRTGYERWDCFDFPCVVIGYNPAAGDSARTVVKLNAGATWTIADDTSSTQYKAAFYYWKRADKLGANLANPMTNKAASHFQSGLRNVDIDMNDTVNSIGVSMGGAQGCYIRDVRVFSSAAAPNFLAGLHALPAAGGLTEGVTVERGRYGVYIETLQHDPTAMNDIGMCATLVACKFVDQSLVPIYNTCSQTMVVVGCEITKSAGAQEAIYCGGPGPLRGNMSIIDCRVERGSEATGPLLAGNRSFYLRNVFARNCRALPGTALTAMDNSSTSSPGRVDPYSGSSGWTAILEYYDGTYGPMSSVSGFTGDKQAPTYINAAVSDARRARIQAIADDQAPAAGALLGVHKAPPTPRWEEVGTSYLSASALTPTPVMPRAAEPITPVTNTTAAIKSLLSSANGTKKGVFLPRGEYYVNETISIPNNLVVFGIDKAFSRLKAYPEVNTGAPLPLVQVGTGTNSAADQLSTTMLCDLTLFTRQDDIGWYLLNWNTGRNSTAKNCNYDRRHVGNIGDWKDLPTGDDLTHELVTIAGATGGGRWYTLWNDSDNAQAVGYSHFKIVGTREPLKIYHFNPETDTNTVNAAINDAQNVEIFTTKWEGAWDGGPNEPNRTAELLNITNSSHFRIHGFAGNSAGGANLDGSGNQVAMIKIRNGTGSSNHFALTQNNQLATNQAGGTGTFPFEWIDDRGVILTPRYEQIVLYKVGQPQDILSCTSGPEGSSNLEGTVSKDLNTNVFAFPAPTDELQVGTAGSIEYRGIAHFPRTAEISDLATIVKVTVRFKVKSKTGTAGTLFLDVKPDATMGGTPNLEADDFGYSTGVTWGAATTAVSSIPNAGGWVTFTFTTTPQNVMSDLTATQYRLRIAGASKVSFYSCSAAEADRPQMEVVYENPAMTVTGS